MTLDRIGVSGRSPAAVFSYDAATGTYTVQDDGLSASFLAADRTSSSGYIDTYSKQAGAISDELTLYGNIRPGGTQVGAPIQLSYLSYGIWSRADGQTGDRRKTYLLFGYSTPTADLPRTGTANYQTSVTGNIIETGPGFPTQEGEVGGSATFSANFETGAVSTGLTLHRVIGQGPLGAFIGTGTIYSDQFTGTFASSSQFFNSGAFMGGFFGPSATEMGYGFYVTKRNPDPYAGATIAPMDTWIEGLVVGKISN